MLSLLLFIVIFILVIGLVIISAVLGFIRSIFSFGKRANQTHTNQSQDFDQPTTKSKIFEKTEGEYVDFEDVKNKGAYFMTMLKERNTVSNPVVKLKSPSKPK